MKHGYMLIIASILSVIAFSHLTYKVHITKETKHLAYLVLFLILSSQLFIFLNGIINVKYHTYLPAFIIILCVSYILYIKIHNERLLFNIF